MMLLTINGKEPNPDLEQHLRDFSSKDILATRISRLLDGKKFSVFDVPAGISGIGYELSSASIEIRALFQGLSVNHHVIEELKFQIEQRLEEIAKLLSDDARLKYTVSRDNRYSESLFALATTHSEWGYNLIKAAAYSRAKNPVFTNEIPPCESRIMSELAAIFGGYRIEHPNEVFNYTKLMDGKKLCLPWVIGSCAEFGNLRALDLYIELFQISEGRDIFVFNGVKRDIAFGYIAYHIYDELLKHGFTREDFLKKIKNLPINLQKQITQNIESRKSN